MATDDPPLLVFLVAGESATKSMRFAPGQAPTTTTIGLDGNWQVGALGVARTHISLFFDGKQLFAGTHGPQLQATINGTPIDGRWWPVRAPSELRFGQACLLVSVDPGAAHPTPPPNLAGPSPSPVGAPGAPSLDPMQMTRLDGIAEWERRRRSGPPPADPNATALYDPRAHGKPVLPHAEQKPPRALEEPSAASTERRPLVPQTGQPAGAPQPHVAAQPPQAAPPPQVGMPPRGSAPPKASSPPADPQFMVKTSYAPLPAAPIPPAAIAVSPPGPAAPSAPPLQQTSYAPLPDLPKTPGMPSGAGFSPEPFAPEPSPLSSSVDRPGGAKKTARTETKTKTKTKTQSAPAENAVLVAWRSASLVKKVTAVLLPVALIAVLLPEPAPQRPAASVRGASSSAPKASSTAVATVVPKPAATPPPVAIATQEEPPRPVPLGSPATPAGSSGRSTATPRGDTSHTTASTAASADAPRSMDGMERSAIDAAFEGRWQDAARVYDRLTTAHPDNLAFAEAARIVRETKLNAH